MNEIASITFRLESYLVQLAETNRRWGAWLETSEAAVAGLDTSALSELLPVGNELMQELRESLVARQRLLEDARVQGLPSADLSGLARALPAWKKPTLRNSLVTARRQLSNLRRLHAATWVLMSRVVHYYGDVMHLLVQGTSVRNVYLSNPKSDTGGGRLLDASL